MECVVITGASSLIGSALVRECIKNNKKVYAVVRKNSKNIENILNLYNVVIIEEDIENIQNICKKIPNVCDVFFHLAWTNTSHRGRKSFELQNKNVDYTCDAVKAAKILGCKRFVCTGSQAEYGIVNGIISPETPVNPCTAYGIAKYEAYKQSKELCKDLNIDHLWIRIFSVYGEYDYKNTMINYAIEEMLAGRNGEFTKSEQLWDYLYCQDAAEGIYLVWKAGKKNSIYCLASGKSRPLKEYILDIRNAINPAIVPGIGRKEYGDSQVMSLQADISSLKKDTGFKPKTSFEVGIRNTVKWYQEKYNNEKDKCNSSNL